MKRRSFFARLAGAIGLAALAQPKPKPVDAKLAATGKWAYFIDGDSTGAEWIDLKDSKQITIAGWRDAEGRVIYTKKVLP